jgi:plastocyanin
VATPAATETPTQPATRTAAPIATPTPWPAVEVIITGRPSTWSIDAVTVGVGSTVTWTWADNIHVHNVTVPGLLGDVPVTKSGSRSLTFQQKGSYTFTCDAHPETMTGTVLVR